MPKNANNTGILHEEGTRPGDPENPGLRNLNAEEPSDLYEVMIEGWGHAPLHRRGDFITAADTPYDVAWGARIGALRQLTQAEAGNVRAVGLESATQPVSEDLKVDLDAQRSARDAAGLPPPPEDEGKSVATPQSSGAMQP